MGSRRPLGAGYGKAKTSPSGRGLPLPLLVLPLALAACAMPVDESDGTAERVGTTAQPLHGVPTDGYPSWDELQGLAG